jgi:hypothetical protein
MDPEKTANSETSLVTGRLQSVFSRSIPNGNVSGLRTFQFVDFRRYRLNEDWWTKLEIHTSS